MGNEQASAQPGRGQLPEKPATPAAPGQQQVSGADQPKYVTLEEAQRLANEAAEAAFRRSQGLYEKGRQGFEARVQAELANFEKVLDLQKKAGMAFTPEQETALRQQAINQAFIGGEQNPPAESPEQPPAQDGGEDDADLDPVTAEAWRMMEDAGIIIEDDDPEAGTLDQSSPYAFLRSIDKAIEAKRQRTGGQQEPASQARTPTNIGSAGSHPNPVANTNDLDQLWGMAKQSGKI